MLKGLNAAGTFAGQVGAGASVAAAITAANQAADPNTNPHLKYVDSNAQGYGYVKVTGDQVASTIVTINRPVTAPTDAGPGVKRTASFTIAVDSPGAISDAVFTGTKPFPLT